MSHGITLYRPRFTALTLALALSLGATATQAGTPPEAPAYRLGYVSESGEGVSVLERTGETLAARRALGRFYALSAQDAETFVESASLGPALHDRQASAYLFGMLLNARGENLLERNAESVRLAMQPGMDTPEALVTTLFGPGYRVAPHPSALRVGQWVYYLLTAPGDGERSPVWIDQENKLVLLGLLLPSDEMTQEHAQTLLAVERAEFERISGEQGSVSQTPTEPAVQADAEALQGRIEAFYRTLEQMTPETEVVQFTGTQRLHVVFNPDCHACRALHESIQAMGEQAFRDADVSVVWHPVAQSDDGIGRGAAILKGGVAALMRNEERFDAAAMRGGIEAIDTPRYRALVQAMARSFRASELPQSTPSLIWRDRAGEVNLLSGAPDLEQLQVVLYSLTPNPKAQAKVSLSEDKSTPSRSVNEVM